MRKHVKVWQIWDNDLHLSNNETLHDSKTQNFDVTLKKISFKKWTWPRRQLENEKSICQLFWRFHTFDFKEDGMPWRIILKRRKPRHPTLESRRKLVRLGRGRRLHLWSISEKKGLWWRGWWGLEEVVDCIFTASLRKRDHDGEDNEAWKRWSTASLEYLCEKKFEIGHGIKDGLEVEASLRS